MYSREGGEEAGKRGESRDTQNEMKGKCSRNRDGIHPAVFLSIQPVKPGVTSTRQMVPILKS